MSQVQVQGRLGGRRETPGAQKVGHHEIRVAIVINIAYATMSRVLGIGGVPRSCRWELSVYRQINVVGRPDDVVAVGEKDVNKVCYNCAIFLSKSVHFCHIVYNYNYRICRWRT